MPAAQWLRDNALSYKVSCSLCLSRACLDEKIILNVKRVRVCVGVCLGGGGRFLAYLSIHAVHDVAVGPPSVPSPLPNILWMPCSSHRTARPSKQDRHTIRQSDGVEVQSLLSPERRVGRGSGQDNALPVVSAAGCELLHRLLPRLLRCDLQIINLIRRVAHACSRCALLLREAVHIVAKAAVDPRAVLAGVLPQEEVVYPPLSQRLVGKVPATQAAPD